MNTLGRPERCRLQRFSSAGLERLESGFRCDGEDSLRSLIRALFPSFLPVRGNSVIKRHGLVLNQLSPAYPDASVVMKMTESASRHYNCMHQRARRRRLGFWGRPNECRCASQPPALVSVS